MTSGASPCRLHPCLHLRASLSTSLGPFLLPLGSGALVPPLEGDLGEGPCKSPGQSRCCVY